MRIWFDFNGQNSIDMGVVLTNIPPVIKPKKRNNTTTIDGVDGCIINELGYDVYIKQIEIGFKQDDLQAVEEWLNGSGKLTICNEPDVYYTATILDSVIYKPDIIYCHATINFLVQPYKYLLYEQSITGNNTVSAYNDGNCVALPKISITGSGTVSLLVNQESVCTLAFGDSIRTLVLDSVTQDCYYNNALANRSMNGNFPVLNKGDNIISTIGNVTNVEVEVRSRWI